MKAMHFLNFKAVFRGVVSFFHIRAIQAWLRNPFSLRRGPRTKSEIEEEEPFVNRLFNFLNNKPIRMKLFVYYFSMFALATTIGSIIIYFVMRSTIETNIERELKNSTTTILNMVQTSAAVSVKNYLRAVVEKNRDIVTYFHNEFLEGRLSEEEARMRASDVLLSQRIGNSGYIYCVNSSGYLMVHPKAALEGVNISRYAFAQEQKLRRVGYLEYDWKNPGETKERAKALYMTYFEPWDWIISASSYREEFNELVNLYEFRDSILSLRFGRTGYPFIMDSKGNLVIHPKLEGRNILEETDTTGRKFIQEIVAKRSGKMIYPWKNPDDDSPRMKLVIFNYIPELDWIVSSSSYLDEFYAPLNTIRDLMMWAVIFSVFIFLPITLRISSSITNPLRELMNKFSVGATGDFTVRMNRKFQDEVGQLAIFFNFFMEKLEAYSTDLKREIQDRRQAEEALRHSEEMFSKAFRSNPNGICIIALGDNRFLNVNDSLLRFSGFSRAELVGRTVEETGIFRDEGEGRQLLRTLKREGRPRNNPVQFLTRNDEVRMGGISAEILEIWEEQCMLVTIEDVTEAHRLEKEIMEISEKERIRIGQDLHDDLCPHLIGIEAMVKVLHRKLDQKEIEDAAMAEKISGLIKDAIKISRSLARGLCPVDLAAHGLVAAVEKLAVNIKEVFGVDCWLECDSPVIFHDNAVATHLYYIIHEAVQNAIKHGHAEHIIIRLIQKKGKLRATVDDDGIGITKIDYDKGMGIRNMGYRAKKIGGAFKIERNREKGTRVRVVL